MARATRRRRRYHPGEFSNWTGGVVLLIATKTTDLFTTIIGLTLVDGLTERNPAGAWVYQQFGIPGIVVLSAVSVAIVVLTVERVGQWIATRESTGVQRSHVYLMSYLPLSFVYSLATVHNSALLLTNLP